MKKINYSDATLKNAGMRLSFREKVEIAKYLNRLDIEAIEVPEIENVQVDSLLTKSIAAAVTQSAVCIPVGMDMSGVDTAWEAVKNAARPVLQVVVPVSPVQMEYKAHKKAPVVMEMAGGLIEKAKSLCAKVEFVAEDATRADESFLRDIIALAAEKGATKITVTDEEGIMLPPEMGEFIAKVRGFVPENITFGVATSNSLGMADICAAAAVQNGADDIKVAVIGECADIQGVTKILNTRKDAIGAEPVVKTTELQKNSEAIKSMGKADAKAAGKSIKDDQAAAIGEFSANDSIEAIKKAVKSLGYDLPDEELVKVYEEFKNVAAKKNVGAKELEAIVASTALQVAPTYELVSYVINSGNIISATAQLEINYKGEALTGVFMGDGPVDAAIKAIEQIIGHHYELDDFQIQAVTEGREAVGEALIRLRADDGRLYSGRGISTDIIGASIRGYINALNKIVYQQ